MRTHTILYRRSGENADTAPVPVRVFDPAVDAVLLSEVATYCVNWDDNGLVTCHVYQVREVELPDWLDPSEWLRDPSGWRFLWAHIGTEFPESVQRGMRGLSGPQRVAARRLLETEKFRSEFRASLAAQLRQWFDAPENARALSPLSRRQWECVITSFDARDAARNDTACYAACQYHALGRLVTV